MEQNNEFKKPVKLINRELKYKGILLTIYEDIVSVGENVCHWDYVEHLGAASVLPMLDDKTVVMVKQYRLALNRYTLEIPAGKLDSKDEDYLVCAKRELEEETGYKSDNFEFMFDSIGSNAFWNTKVRCFLARDLKESTMHNDRDEETIVEYWNIYDLKEKILKGEINDAKTISSIMTYFVKYMQK